MVAGVALLTVMFWRAPVLAAALPTPDATSGRDEKTGPETRIQQRHPDAGVDTSGEDTRVALPDRT
jgi:hypothetical protein